MLVKLAKHVLHCSCLKGLELLFHTTFHMYIYLFIVFYPYLSLNQHIHSSATRRYQVLKVPIHLHVGGISEHLTLDDQA